MMGYYKIHQQVQCVLHILTVNINCVTSITTTTPTTNPIVFFIINIETILPLVSSPQVNHILHQHY